MASKKQTNLLICYFSFIIAFYLFLAALFMLPEGPMPDWFIIGWRVCSVLTAIILYRMKQLFNVTGLMSVVLGPVVLLAYGFIYFSKKMGFYRV